MGGGGGKGGGNENYVSKQWSPDQTESVLFRSKSSSSFRRLGIKFGTKRLGINWSYGASDAAKSLIWAHYLHLSHKKTPDLCGLTTSSLISHHFLFVCCCCLFLFLFFFFFFFFFFFGGGGGMFMLLFCVCVFLFAFFYFVVIFFHGNFLTKDIKQ